MTAMYLMGQCRHDWFSLLGREYTKSGQDYRDLPWQGQCSAPTNMKRRMNEPRDRNYRVKGGDLAKRVAVAAVFW
jgi:hypothetical protein